MHTRLFLIALLALPSPASGQASPTDVVRAFFDAYYAEEWSSAASHFHSDFAASFKQQYIEDARQFVDYRPPTASDLMERDPDMPLEVAEYRAKQRAEAESYLPFAPPSLTLEEATNADPLTILATSLRDTDFRPRFRASFSHSAELSSEPVTPEAREELEALLQLKPELVGHFLEGEWAWVLYRSTLVSPSTSGSQQRSPPDVIGLRMEDKVWRISDQRVASGFAITGFFVSRR